MLQLVDSLGLFRRVFRAIKQFETSDQPDVQVHLEQERYFSGPSSALDAGLDAVVYLQAACREAPRDCEVMPLGTCEFSVVVSPRNPLAGQSRLSVADLRGQRLSRLTGGSSVLNHIWDTIRLECMGAGVDLSSTVTHKVFHPAEVLDISLRDDEAFILPSDSQSVPNMGQTDSLCCIPLVDFSQQVVVACRSDNAVAARFCDVLVAMP